MPSHFRHQRLVLALLIAVTTMASSTGCVGMLAQIGYMAGANKMPADFDGLQGKKVAVVCVSEAAEFDRGEEAMMLGAGVEQLLRVNVKEIQIINQDKVADWTDKNNWNEFDYKDAGKGLGADMVVGIDLHRYSLTDGSTLFKGRSHYSLRVFDMSKDGEVVFRRADQMYEFPLHGGRPGDSTNRKAFQRSYISLLSERIARMFYRYEFSDDIALDAVAS